MRCCVVPFRPRRRALSPVTRPPKPNQPAADLVPLSLPLSSSLVLLPSARASPPRAIHLGPRSRWMLQMPKDVQAPTKKSESPGDCPPRDSLSLPMPPPARPPAPPRAPPAPAWCRGGWVAWPRSPFLPPFRTKLITPLLPPSLSVSLQKPRPPVRPLPSPRRTRTRPRSGFLASLSSLACMLNLPSSRGLSSYMIFSSENRERIKAENPEAGFGGSFFFFIYLLRTRRNASRSTRAATFIVFRVATSLRSQSTDSTRLRAPLLPAGEIGKLLGLAWKDLSEQEKAVSRPSPCIPHPTFQLTPLSITSPTSPRPRPTRSATSGSRALTTPPELERSKENSLPSSLSPLCVLYIASLSLTRSRRPPSISPLLSLSLSPSRLVFVCLL